MACGSIMLTRGERARQPVAIELQAARPPRDRPPWPPRRSRWRAACGRCLSRNCALEARARSARFRRSRSGRNSIAGRAARRRAAAGRALWPHSPPIAWAPASGLPSITSRRPRRCPGSRRTRRGQPRPAPSAASETAKQLASFDSRTSSRSRTRSRSRSSGRPFSRVELAFLIRPVAGEIAPGWPTPTRQRAPTLRFELAHHGGDALDGRLVAALRRGHAHARAFLAAVVEHDAFDFGAAEIDADTHGRLLEAVECRPTHGAAPALRFDDMDGQGKEPRRSPASAATDRGESARRPSCGCCRSASSSPGAWSTTPSRCSSCR